MVGRKGDEIRMKSHRRRPSRDKPEDREPPTRCSADRRCQQPLSKLFPPASLPCPNSLPTSTGRDDIKQARSPSSVSPSLLPGFTLLLPTFVFRFSLFTFAPLVVSSIPTRPIAVLTLSAVVRTVYNLNGLPPHPPAIPTTP